MKLSRTPKRHSPKPRPLRPRAPSQTRDGNDVEVSGHVQLPSVSPSASNSAVSSCSYETRGILTMGTNPGLFDNIDVSCYDGFQQDSSSSAAANAEAMLSLKWIPQIQPPLSVYHIPLPNSLNLCKEELYAPKHYEAIFASTQTSKDPRWSFPKLLLHQASESPMTMHFALATALYDLDMQHDMEKNTINRLLAHRHFSNGSSKFQKVVPSSTDKEHVEILSCFYYIYISMSRQSPSTKPSSTPSARKPCVTSGTSPSWSRLDCLPPMRRRTVSSVD